MKKKGQAALEFLMTYGWAILAAIIVIGVLAIYFRPSTLTSNNVIVREPFYAVGAAINASTIQLEIRNNGGEDINVTTGSLTFNTPSTGSCTDATSGEILAAGATRVLNFAPCNMGTGTISADVAVRFFRPGSSLEQISVGSISGSVQ